MAARKRVSTNPEWTSGELRTLRSLKGPCGIQRFLNDLTYNLEGTARSPRYVLHHRTAHCFEGALFAASALRIHGYPARIVDFEAVRDTDHVIAVFRDHGLWGSIATSNYSGVRGRQPVYRSLRELVMSYFEGYFNLAGERTLRTYSRPVNMKMFDALRWETCAEPVWFVAEYLFTISHTPLHSDAQARGLARIDARTKAAGLVGHRRKRR